MKHNQLFKKIGTIAMIIGAVAILISLICFIGLGVVSGKVEEAVGYKPTADELGDVIDKAKSAAERVGGDLQFIADFIGISAIELTLIQFFLAFKIPTLVTGIIALVIGVGVMLLTKASGTIYIDYVVFKCGKCGKTLVPGTKLCPNCGNNLEKICEGLKRIKCPVCESEILKNSKFCSVCGAVINSENPPPPDEPSSGEGGKGTRLTPPVDLD